MSANISPSLEINTNVGCSNACVYCPQRIVVHNYNLRKGQSSRMMELEFFKATLEKVPRDVHIVFSGMSEPWLNPACTEMVLYAHNNGFNLSVYTTLVGMTIKDIRRIEYVPFRDFVVHLPDDDGHTQIPYDEEHVEKIGKLQESQIRNVRFVVFGSLHRVIKPIVKNHVAQRTIISRAGNVEKKDVAALLPKTSFRSNNLKSGRIVCGRSTGNVLRNNALLPDGHVTLCCMDYGLEHVLGNLLTDSYTCLFQSKEYRRVKEGQLANSGPSILCRTCSDAVRDNTISKCTYWLKNQIVGALSKRSPRFLGGLKHVGLIFQQVKKMLCTYVGSKACR